MKIDINNLKEYVKIKGLELLKEETDTLKNLESTVEDIDAGLIDLYEKKFDSLKKEEEKALEEEDFASLKRIKDEQVEVLDKLIKFYEKKVEILNRIGGEIRSSADQIGSKGNDVFSNKELGEFKNEETTKGTKLKISGSGKYFIVDKVSENNTYRVLETNINGIENGDFLKLSDMKIGGSGEVTVYRKMGDRFEELKTMKFNNVNDIIKNPK